MNGTLDKLTPGFYGKLTFLMDLLLVALAVLLSANLALPHTVTSTFSLVACGLAGWGISISMLRLYSPYTRRSSLDNLALATLAVLVVTAGLFAIDVLALASPPYHFAPFTFAAILWVGVVSTQLLVLKPLRNTAPAAEQVLIVGTGPLGTTTYRRLAEGGARSREVIGFLNFADQPKSLPDSIDAPVLGTAEDLLRAVEEHPVSEVYLAARVLDRGPEMQKAIRLCEEVGLPFAVPLHSFEYNRAQLLSRSKARDGYLHYLNTESKPVQHAVKRVIDIVGATVGLVLLSPLLIGVAIAIKLESQGPVFFRQRRVGLHGDGFNFLKFRSMCTGAAAMKDDLLDTNEMDGPVFKMKNDPRVTKVGRFIRKFSIDELPQLVNILRGDMTIVGPRPPVPREVAEYKPWQRRRLSVRPGLTCYWQVGGRNDISFEEWMILDLRYVDNWTVWKDIFLILKTIPVVLLGKGAS